MKQVHVPFSGEKRSHYYKPQRYRGEGGSKNLGLLLWSDISVSHRGNIQLICCSWPDASTLNHIEQLPQGVCCCHAEYSQNHHIGCWALTLERQRAWLESAPWGGRGNKGASETKQESLGHLHVWTKNKLSHSKHTNISDYQRYFSTLYWLSIRKHRFTGFRDTLFAVI